MPHKKESLFWSLLVFTNPDNGTRAETVTLRKQTICSKRCVVVLSIFRFFLRPTPFVSLFISSSTGIHSQHMQMHKYANCIMTFRIANSYFFTSDLAALLALSTFFAQHFGNWSYNFVFAPFRMPIAF